MIDLTADGLLRRQELRRADHEGAVRRLRAAGLEELRHPEVEDLEAFFPVRHGQ